MAATPASAASNRDAVWAEMNLHLTRSRGLCLVFLYAEDSRSLQELRTRLDDVWAWRTAPLSLIQPASPVGAAAAVIQELEGEVIARPALRAPVWLQLTTLDPHATGGWEDARHQVLYRLNEWRSWLQQHFRRPLVIALPPAWQAQVAAVAPDLWHIRTMSARIVAPRDGGPARADVRPFTRPRDESAGDVDVLDVDALSSAVARAREAAEQGAEAAVRDLAVQLTSLGDQLHQSDRWEEAEAALNEAFERLDGLRMRAGDADAFAVERRVTAERLGDVKFDLGQYEAALRFYREALALWEAAGGASPWKLRRVISLLINISDVLVELHRTEEADAVLRAAQDRWSELSDTTREVLSQEGLQAELLMRQAARFFDSGRADEAVDRYRQAVAVQRGLLAEAADPVRVRTVLAQWLIDLGAAQDYINQADAARASIDESVALLQTLIAESPENLALLVDLATGLMAQGDLVDRQQQWPAALELYEEAVALARRYAQEMGHSVRAIHLLINALTRLGEAQAQLEDAAASVATFGECQSLIAQLLARHGDTADALRMRTIVLEGLAAAHLAMGDAATAIDELQNSLALARQLVEQSARSPSTLRDLAITLQHLARAFTSAQGWDEASACWSEALSLYQELRKVEGDSHGVLAELADCLEGLALSLIRRADAGIAASDEELAAARSHVDNALVLRHRLAEAFPHQSQHRDALAHSLAIQESLRSNGRASP